MKHLYKTTVPAVILLSLLILFPSLLSAQETIFGSVMTKKGEPIPGALVRVQGNDRGGGELTNEQGRYKGIVPNTDAVLEISAKGYKKQEVALSGQMSFIVSLKPTRKHKKAAKQEASERQISTGYSTIDEKNISSAISSTNVSAVLSLPATGIDQALQGHVSGLLTDREGGPGGAAMLRLRGMKSFLNQQPLFVIDGVPVEEGLDEIHLYEINEVQVLKDASATAMYGARGSHGVILISTTLGKAENDRFSFHSWYGTQSAPASPAFLSPAQLADVLWQADLNEGNHPAHPQYGAEGQAVLPDYLLAGNRGGLFQTDPATASQLYAWPDYTIVEANKAGTDWIGEIFNPAPVQNYQLSANGANQRSAYLASGAYMDQKGIVQGTFYKRISVRLNSNSQIHKRLRIGQNLSVVYSNRNGLTGGNQQEENAITMAHRMPGIVPVYDIAGHFAGTKAPGLGDASNPVAMQIRAQDNADRRLRLLGGIFAELRITPRLYAKTQLGVDFHNRHATAFTFRDAENLEPGLNQLTEITAFRYQWNWINTLQYSRKFGKAHKLHVLAGTEAIESRQRAFSASRSDFFSNDVAFRYLNMGQRSMDNSGQGSEWAMSSLFGRLDYAYKGKYLLSASIRQDASSRFGSNNRSGIFPAYSVGWRLSDEKFIRRLGLFDDLKLRYGWGIVGNDRMGDFAYASNFGGNIARSYYDINGTNTHVVAGVDSESFGNPDLRWEETLSTNIGIDATLIKGRLDVVVDLYEQTTSGLLVRQQLPATAGLANPRWVNSGIISNKGMDLGLSLHSKSGALLEYTIGATFSKYQNEVLRISDSPDDFLEGGEWGGHVISRTQAGLPVASYYGYVLEGIFQNQDEVEAHAQQTGKAVGRFKYQDVNGDGTIDENDKSWLGSPHPDFAYSAYGQLKFAQFDCSVMIQGVKGNEIYNGLRLYTDFLGDQGNKSDRLLHAWEQAGDGVINGAYDGLTLPQLTSDMSAQAVPSSYFVEDGSYLRIKNIQVGYTFPKTLISHWGFSKLRVYMQARDYLTFTSYSGLDPELYSSSLMQSGLDKGNYPITKTLIFGIDLQL